jgi:transcriptional regulator with XRE-family HTH domain
MPIAPEYNAQIALRLKEARLDNKMNQSEFAKKLGVSRASVSQWEAGSTKPSMTRLRMVSELTQRPLSWFLIEDATAAMAASNNPADNIINTISALPPILREVLFDSIDDLRAYEKTMPAWIWKTLPPAGAERDAFVTQLKREIWKNA